MSYVKEFLTLSISNYKSASLHNSTFQCKLSFYRKNVLITIEIFGADAFTISKLMVPTSAHVIILNFVNSMLNKRLAHKKLVLRLNHTLSITPFQKEGDKDNPDHYWGLCIMNTLWKLVCTMMSKRL